MTAATCAWRRRSSACTGDRRRTARSCRAAASTACRPPSRSPEPWCRSAAPRPPRTTPARTPRPHPAPGRRCADLPGRFDHTPAHTASSSMTPSPMKKPGPTARFTHGKQLQSVAAQCIVVDPDEDHERHQQRAGQQGAPAAEPGHQNPARRPPFRRCPTPGPRPRLNDWGTLACAMRMAAPCTSVIFQIPDTRNRSASRTAAIQLTAVFQPGSSSAANPPRGCAILSFMALLYPLERFQGLGRGGLGPL